MLRVPLVGRTATGRRRRKDEELRTGMPFKVAIQLTAVCKVAVQVGLWRVHRHDAQGVVGPLVERKRRDGRALAARHHRRVARAEPRRCTRAALVRCHYHPGSDSLLGIGPRAVMSANHQMIRATAAPLAEELPRVPAAAVAPEGLRAHDGHHEQRRLLGRARPREEALARDLAHEKEIRVVVRVWRLVVERRPVRPPERVLAHVRRARAAHGEALQRINVHAAQVQRGLAAARRWRHLFGRAGRTSTFTLRRRREGPLRRVRSPPAKENRIHTAKRMLAPRGLQTLLPDATGHAGWHSAPSGQTGTCPL
eukprot:6398862-Prymnesium_polylepis.1